MTFVVILFVYQLKLLSFIAKCGQKKVKFMIAAHLAKL